MAPKAKAIAKKTDASRVHAQKMRSNNTLRVLRDLDKKGRSFPLQHFLALKRGSAEKDKFCDDLTLDKGASFLSALEANFIDTEKRTAAEQGPFLPWDVCRLSMKIV